MSDDYTYQGDELEVFALARGWKAYIRSCLQPLLGSHVLEVGAGFGSITNTLLQARTQLWTALEPDRKLAERIAGTLCDHPYRERVQVVTGATDDLEPRSDYDTILYIDVLEHIEDDVGELRRAAGFLREGGRCIVLSPAYQFLYTPFDEALGHFRRYTAGTLAETARPVTDLRTERFSYLDSVGLIASLANKLLLRQSLPTAEQILFWDRRMIPLSRYLTDPLARYRLGRSVIGVWRKTRAAENTTTSSKN
jgi:SAM-dependent methyltransferase